MSNVQKGLRCNVYRDGGIDCTNNRVTSKVNTVTLVGPGIPEIFEADDKAPLFVVGEIMGRVHAKPADLVGHSMHGGNFIYCSDSRFCWDYPIPVHDRQE